MRYWEFLIQQEGDQTWLPLETRQVEILEGRYRMAAHTSYDSTSVEIRVSQLLLDEIPPRRRVRKRKANTNDSGLLAIFPFIQLSPGHWEIDCNSPDVIDDFLGEGGWQYSVQLQVTPREEEDWEPNWLENSVEPGSGYLAVDTAESNNQSPSDSLNETIDSSLSVAVEFQLQLKQQAYVTQLGQALTLTGHLSQGDGSRLNKGQLWVELRDPQTANTIQKKAFDVPNTPLPSQFSVTVTLPDELSTQVVLGAISLVSAEKPLDGAVLASASFTVTIGLAQLLDAIANQPDLEFEEETSIFPGSTEAFVPSPEKSAALLAAEAPILPKEIIPSAGFTLPPQIKPPNDFELDSERQPELPTFPTQSDSVQTDSNAKESSAAASDIHPEEVPTPEAKEDTELGEASPPEFPEHDVLETAPGIQDLNPEPPKPQEQTPFAEPRVIELKQVEEDDLDLELATAALNDESALEASLSSVDDDTPDQAASYVSPPASQWNSATVNIDRAFQKLQLRERFWQKLSGLTQDGYRQSLEVKKALHPSEPLASEGNPQRNEFVVYEPRIRSHQSDQAAPQAAAEPIQVLPPILDVPDQELVAGEWIAIKVRVPANSYQPYVKVWMNDLQTRTMIDAPRLLMQFIPNDHNELETLMRIQVPTGCLELQFAAISIDMTTLQESRKVIQNRRVMPPDESSSIFDDWDI